MNIVQLIVDFALCNMKEPEILAILQVLGGKSLLKSSSSEEDETLGIVHGMATLDKEGEPLIAGHVYMYRGNKIKVLREEFGSGNMLDTYYRVFFLDSDFKERWLIAEVEYKKGLSSSYYPSELTPLK